MKAKRIFRQVFDTLVVGFFIMAAFLLGATIQMWHDAHFTPAEHSQTMTLTPVEGSDGE